MLHLDLDAFFAAVEQRDKPSLRGKPVVVGGVGARGVVATASYEARAYGVHSAMPSHQARARCPHAAYLAGRFGAYRTASTQVMKVLRSVSPLVEPLSLDEAFVDLATSDLDAFDVDSLTAFATDLKTRVADATGGLTASIGVGTSKFIAKVASDLDKPAGLVVVPAGTEVDLLRPMHVRVIPGVGPATVERLARVGVETVADLETLSLDELVRELGRAHGTWIHSLARAMDDRPVVAEREAKSISTEGTYETDLVDRTLIAALLTGHARDVARRLDSAGHSGRTVTIKVRLADFSTLSRSTTLASPTNSAATITRLAQGLLTDVDTSAGVRLLGVGVSGLSDWIQDDLFGESTAETTDEPTPSDPGPGRKSGWAPGQDVVHDVHGRGWVWGSGRGVVTVRFETRDTPPGPVRSLPIDDPALRPWVEPPTVEDELNS